MQTTIIRDWAAFDQLEPEWNELLFRSQASSIFLTWEWISAWRTSINDSVPPYVIVIRNAAGKLLGAAPLYRSSMRLVKVLPYRVLRYMADFATGSEYPDWIVDRADEEAISNAIAAALESDSKSWDVLWLPKVAGWTGAYERLLSKSAKERFRYRARTQVFSCFVLGETLAVYENSLSANRRQQVRRTTRKIEAVDGVTFDVCDSVDELPEYLEALIDLHQRRWQALGKEGVFRRKPAEERFYRSFVPKAMEMGWLALFSLRHHGRINAVQIGYIFDNVYHQLQEGYDPDFEDGAGNALRHHAIGHLIERGVESYDFLGGWSEHKRRWGAETRDGHEVFIAARKPRTLPLFVADVWPSGRFIDMFAQQTDKAP